MSHETLTRKDVYALVDALRRSLLYQTPHPIFLDTKDDAPDRVVVKLRTPHYETVMKLILKAGGWVLPPEAAEKIRAAHEQRALEAYGDGTDHDLSKLEIGELYEMHAETRGIDTLAKFHHAIGDEIEARAGRGGRAAVMTQVEQARMVVKLFASARAAKDSQVLQRVWPYGAEALTALREGDTVVYDDTASQQPTYVPERRTGVITQRKVLFAEQGIEVHLIVKANQT